MNLMSTESTEIGYNTVGRKEYFRCFLEKAISAAWPAQEGGTQAWTQQTC